VGLLYHAQALGQNVNTDDFMTGSANIAVVREVMQKRIADGSPVECNVEHAIERLRDYFASSAVWMSEHEQHLAYRQNVLGEMLSEEEGETLKQAETRSSKVALSSKAEAKRDAQLIQQATRGWSG